MSLSIIELYATASLPVQLVMVLLIGASVLSWTLIVGKGLGLARAARAAQRFERGFHGDADLGELYQQWRTRGGAPEGHGALFMAGFGEFRRLRGRRGVRPDDLVSGIQRAMHAALIREEGRLSGQLDVLATIGSVSPYVGLFGTVWGIMNAFHGLGNVQQATIAMVAPGISEALIATAMGLVAAIPAVIAYNRYNGDVERLTRRYEAFIEEFALLVHGQALLTAGDAPREPG